MDFHFLVILYGLKMGDFQARCTSAILTLKTSVDGPARVARRRRAATAESVRELARRFSYRRIATRTRTRIGRRAGRGERGATPQEFETRRGSGVSVGAARRARASPPPKPRGQNFTKTCSSAFSRGPSGAPPEPYPVRARAPRHSGAPPHLSPASTRTPISYTRARVFHRRERGRGAASASEPPTIPPRPEFYKNM